MIKLVAVFKKEKNLDVDSFQSQLLKSDLSAVKALPNLKGYSQSHTIKSGYSKITPAADGIAEFEFDNVDDCRECMNSTEFDKVRQELNQFTKVKEIT